MEWIGIVLKGVYEVIEQWVTASAEERKAIEDRALQAARDMIVDRTDTTKAHDDRTAATLAEIDQLIADKKAKELLDSGTATPNG